MNVAKKEPKPEKKLPERQPNKEYPRENQFRNENNVRHSSFFTHEKDTRKAKYIPNQNDFPEIGTVNPTTTAATTTPPTNTVATTMAATGTGTSTGTAIEAPKNDSEGLKSVKRFVAEERKKEEAQKKENKNKNKKVSNKKEEEKAQPAEKVETSNENLQVINEESQNTHQTE